MAACPWATVAGAAARSTTGRARAVADVVAAAGTAVSITTAAMGMAMGMAMAVVVVGVAAGGMAVAVNSTTRLPRRRTSSRRRPGIPGLGSACRRRRRRLSTRRVDMAARGVGVVRAMVRAIAMITTRRDSRVVVIRVVSRVAIRAAGIRVVSKVVSKATRARASNTGLLTRAKTGAVEVEDTAVVVVVGTIAITGVIGSGDLGWTCQGVVIL